MEVVSLILLALILLVSIVILVVVLLIGSVAVQVLDLLNNRKTSTDKIGEDDDW